MSRIATTVDHHLSVSKLVDDLITAAEVGVGDFARTPLGRSMVQARREYLATGQQFLTLEEIRAEVAERRGSSEGRDQQ